LGGGWGGLTSLHFLSASVADPDSQGSASFWGSRIQHRICIRVKSRIRIRITVKRRIRIRIKVKIQELRRLKMEPWRVCRSVVADWHDFDEDPDPDPHRIVSAAK
jgi:hypothetical protein